ncbi:metallopeptidase family protein [Nocardioides marmoraquaticus]
MPAARTRRERFDRLALDVLDDLADRGPEVLGAVELAVEECPVVPPTWGAPRVPLATMVPSTPTAAPRLVLFRRPLEQRADDAGDLAALVLTVVVEQLADYLGLPGEDLHPDYEPPD